MKLFTLLLLSLLPHYNASAGAYYVQDNNPWGQTTNQTCMTAVFGAGGWTLGSTSTPAATIFAPTTTFVMLEGSDGNSNMPNFINANITTIENWVSNGGRLFMNAAPNYGTNQTWGFSSTQLNYPSYANSVTTTVPTNDIFLGPMLPTATTYTGSAFAHAYITGTGLTSLLYDQAFAANQRSVLCYKLWGNGVVFFGGCTQPNFWSPSPQSTNLWENIFFYVNNFPLSTLTTTVTGSPWCAGDALSIDYSSTGLTLNAGNVFNVELSDATGSFATPTVIGSLASTATSGTINCTIPVAQPPGTGYRIRTTSSNVALIGADNGTDLTINALVTPTISISASPGNNVCVGTNVTFTATLTNGGPAPSYQWTVNGNPVGNLSTYSSNALNDGDVVACTLTSNAPCATPTTAASNDITMTITPPLAATINISTPSDTGCAGQPMVFSSTVQYGGPTPTYQWMKNGNPVGGNTATYTDNTLIDGDVISCDLTSSNPCVPPAVVSSNSITVTIIPVVVPTVTITADPGSNICSGSAVTFTATGTDQGDAPVYMWHNNLTNVGTDQNTYTSTTLTNGNVISCTMVSNATCAIPDTVTSNNISITTFSASPYLSGSLGNSVSKSQLIAGYSNNLVRDANCNLMVAIEPQWQNPVDGNTNVTVTIDPDVMVYNGQPYLQRHFDIEPANNATEATGFITLYAYQSEFDAYNAVADTMGLPLMPTNYIQTGNIRVTQFHGTGTEPGNYSAGTYTVINPAVSWDPVHQWWQLIFPVTGFSGFYIHTGNVPLNLKQVQPDDFSVVAYPNPVQDKVTVQVYGRQAAHSMISVTDITGRTIVEVPMANDKAIADLSSLAKGFYLVKYSDDERTQTIKITKQ
ncbi:MAG: hypothetical protein BGO69_10620 [Bacteroidetes bacterium 46-16]|nr:MAG: hypothetical protein BGO69_10620 [Bacteroidetes bacterium 46-16]